MAGRGSLRRGSSTRTGWRTESGTNTETSTLQDFMLGSKFPLVADFCLGPFLFQDAEASESWHDGKAQRRTDERCHIFLDGLHSVSISGTFSVPAFVSVTTTSYRANLVQLKHQDVAACFTLLVHRAGSQESSLSFLSLHLSLHFCENISRVIISTA